jgi:copper(I)-binding protein
MIRQFAAIVIATAALAGCTAAPVRPTPPPTTTSTTSTTSTKPADGGLPVTEQAYTVRPTAEDWVEVGYAAILRNTSTRDATIAGTITVRWLDANGAELKMGATSDDLPAREHGVVPRLLPGEQTAVAGTFFVAGEPASMTVTVDRAQWRPADEVPAGMLTAANAALTRGVDGPENSAVTVTVTSTHHDPVDATAALVVRDAAGALLGGIGYRAEALRGIPPGTSTHTIEVDTDTIPDTAAGVQVVLTAASP